jgi:hypothetical protein
VITLSTGDMNKIGYLSGILEFQKISLIKHLHFFHWYEGAAKRNSDSKISFLNQGKKGSEKFNNLSLLDFPKSQLHS